MFPTCIIGSIGAVIPQAGLVVSAKRLILIEAFKSRSIEKPQLSQLKTLSDSKSFSFLQPQFEQVFELGNHLEANNNSEPNLSAL